MKATTRVTTYGAFLMVLLGSAFGQHIQTDFDHQANFSRYKTYSWQEVKASNSLWDDRIKDAVNAQLAAKGWTQVDNGADVAIVAIKTTQTEKTLQPYYANFGFGGGWGWRRFGGYGDSFGDSTTTEQDYKEGTLVVDMYDASTKQLIWRASAEDMLSDKAEKNEKNLDKGVAKMFKSFPPRSTKG